MLTQVYAIQRRSDGFYSTGGRHPDFTTKGRLWMQLAHVKMHYTQAIGVRELYAHCDIVEFTLTEHSRIGLASVIPQ